jgi:hypothetical protein
MMPPIGKVAENMNIFFLLAVLLFLGTETSFTNSFSTGTTSCRKNVVGIKNMGLLSTNIPRERSRRDSSIYSTEDNDGVMPDRRDLLQKSSLLAGATLMSALNIAPGIVHASTDADDSEDFQVFKTDSGLKYIELEEGTVGDSSKTPQYGQLCVISYTAYLQLPKDDKKTKFASQSGFVLKHGNGKLIAGLDEGLHSMKRGGRRRLIIPPKLGFVTDGLGPIPEMPWQRETLNSLLNRMVKQQGGNLIYDVQLERFFDDEADQGYYQDDEISPEEFAELNRRLNKKNNAVGSVGDDIEVTERDKEKPIV